MSPAVVAGIALGVVAVAAIGVWWVLARRKRNGDDSANASDSK